MNQISQNRDMTEAQLDAYFLQFLNERAPLDVAAMSTADLETLAAETGPLVKAGPSLMGSAIEIGAMHCADPKAVVRSATYFVSLLIARAYTAAGAR